jgi:hypothetical protein
MVQGGKVNKKTNNIQSKRKNKHEAKKQKAGGIAGGREEDLTEVEKSFNKKVEKHQKKIYRSIEDTIIQNAKKNRERFDII